MVINELLNEQIDGVVETEDMYYVLYAAGHDEAVESIDKKTNETKCLYSIVSNGYIKRYVKEGKAKVLSESEIEEFKQFLVSFSSR